MAEAALGFTRRPAAQTPSQGKRWRPVRREGSVRLKRLPSTEVIRSLSLSPADCALDAICAFSCSPELGVAAAFVRKLYASDMNCAFIYTFISLHPFFNMLSAAVHPPGREDSPWFLGCFNASDSSFLYTPKGVHDLDPVTCSARCLDDGYQVAALTLESCYCGSNALRGLVVSECFNASPNKGSNDGRGGSERQSVLHWPVGSGQGIVALYTTEGPFLHSSIHLVISADIAQAGKAFLMEVSGKLAGRPNQPTGILNVGEQDLSYVTVEFLGMTLKTQHSCHPSSDHLVIPMLHDSLGTPSCAPFKQTDLHGMAMQVMLLGDPVTLQEYVGEGLVVGHPALSDLNIGASGNQLTAGECIFLSVELFTTINHLSLTLNPKNSSYATGEEAVVVLLFNHTGTVAVELRAENQVSSQNKSVIVSVEGNRKPSPQVRVNPNWQPPNNQSPVHKGNNAVRIYAAKQAYPTNTNITFIAVADVPEPVEFIWHFGDSKSARTTSRTVIKRYNRPGRFDVLVAMSDGQIPITSEVFPVVVQRVVRLNRLVHQASVLQNQTVRVSCRVSVGTNLTFLWSFGDGSYRMGQSTEQHVFHRTGEFRVEVTVWNLVSSASLSSYIFVVDRPCQPPPVKNMGPLQLQVRRYEVIHLGVTYERDIDCDITGGLYYTWTLFDSAHQPFPLPLTDMHRQSLTLQSHLLHYDTYTAIARVQVTGSVVYSNYSVRIKVMPSSPVAFIQGGTNVFINNRNTTLVTLDGQRSYDPDFPLTTLSYSWTCKPVSSIISSCFNQYVPTSSPVLTFPVSFLKHNFDQFQVVLTVYSREHSASSETFLTVMPHTLGKVSLYCHHCHGDQVNWDQSFSVSVSCEDCNISPEQIQYTWHLYLVNASTQPVIEVPFCHAVDRSAPSTIIQGPVTSLQTPGAFTLHPSPTDTSHYTHIIHASAPVLPTEVTSKTTASKQNLDLTDNGISSNKSRNMSNKAGEESFYHPLGEFDPPENHSTSENPLHALDILFSDKSDQSEAIGEFPVDFDSSADWEISFPVLESDDIRHQLDYDVPLTRAEEGDPGVSAGRPSGVDGETFSLGDDSVFDPSVHKDEGSNLVDSKASSVIQEPTLLDLPRDPVDMGLFESYTYTGISSPMLSFRPFSLRPGSRYMLEATAKSRNIFLGRTQLFLKTKPAPKGMMCQVQPVNGVELYTHFSIFCTSGKEDLLYKYSFSVGGRPPRMLYQGRNFQYYFRLPSGDPSDDYKVTIYTEVRSGTYGTATKPCPVTVRVQPSFVRESLSSHWDPDLELSESGLRNLSVLVQTGNSLEIRNYISLLSSILNKLSLDPKANTHAQRHIRSALICTVCELKSSEQQSMVDGILTLRDLLQTAGQVSLESARRVTAHVQAISDQFLESSTPVQYHLDHETLDTLITLLSYILQATATSHDFTLETPHSVSIIQALDSPTGQNLRNTTAAPDAYVPDSSSGAHIKQGGLSSEKQVVQLVADLLQTASDLMLKYLLFHNAQEHRVSTGLITLFATYQNQNSTVISSGSTTYHIPVSLIQQLFVHSREHESVQQLCVLSVLTELTHSPYPQDQYPAQLRGPVVDLSMHKCSSRRKVPVRSLIQPINIELHYPQRKTSVHEYVLFRHQVNYHSFNITQEHLQQVIQLSVAFTSLPSKLFPIMLLFRMFDRPTPSAHHLHRIHHWESNTTRITLSPFYLRAAGVGHLALLSAAKATRQKHLSEQMHYSLTVYSSLCLSWDSHQGAWTPHGCNTQEAHTADSVNCSCYRLRPLTVVQHQIQSNHDTADLDSISDLTVLAVLVSCVCLYILGLVVCKRADIVSEQNRRVHYLTDNSPCDPYLYAATIHTGLCSAAYMSAKVCIVLYGENGISLTRELQVPGCTLFRRNSQDTFLFSAADSLGHVWGVHIWHDNSGPSPTWYIKQVEVSEVNRGHVKGRAWLFVGQCWLAVNKGDGQVERMLRVCTQGIGFAKMLCLKLSDYLADFHIWISVYSCPYPNSFTHTQRLSVCLMLLLGYACVNAVIISHATDDQLPFDLGIIDASATSVMTGVLSVVAVLPAATMISFLFRLHEVKPVGSGVQHASGRNTANNYFGDDLSVNDGVPHISWIGLQQRAQETWRKKCQGTDLLSRSTTGLENKDTDKESVIQPDVTIRKEDAPEVRSGESCKFHETEVILSSVRDEYQATQEEKNPEDKRSSNCGFEETWPDKLRGRRFKLISEWCRYLSWALCLLLSLSCLVLSAVLGMSFSISKALLWIHSLFFSLVSCMFFVQPLVILAVAVTVSFWYANKPDFHSFSSITESEIEASNLWSHNGANHPEEQFRSSAFLQRQCSYLKKQLRARQRARHLRLVRPPAPADLRKISGKKRRETLIHNTLRDLFICVSMLFLVLCITYGSSSRDHYHLNKAIRKQYTRNSDNEFMSIQKQEDWWKWTQTSLLNVLYKNASKTEQLHILIGEPMLWKSEVSCSFQSQVSSVPVVPECLRLFLMGSRASTHAQSNVVIPVALPPKTCGRLGCYSKSSAAVGLGHTKSDAASILKQLHSGDWLGEQTVDMKVQFTLYSPAPNLFTSVTLLTQQSPIGVLLPSSKVQSVRVYHNPAGWDYVAMMCQLLFLLLSLLLLRHQINTVRQQGLMGYCRTPSNWLEVTLLTVNLAHYVYYLCQSVLTMDIVELLQRHNYKGHVDVSLLATMEQNICTLRGVMLFLIAIKCVTVLRVNRTLATSATLFTRSLSILYWPMISGLILLVALSCVGNLLFVQSSWAFSSIPRTLQTLLSNRCGLRAIKGLLFSGRDFLYCGLLCLSSTVAWTAVVMGAVSSMVRSVKRSQRRRKALTVAELASYIRQKVSEFTGPTRTDNHMERKTYYLEEFESSVDELLFKLNAVLNRLHQTLPPKAQCYMEEESPITSPTQEPFSMDTQVSQPHVKHAEKTQTHSYILVSHTVHYFEKVSSGKLISTHLTNVSGHGKTSHASHLLRSRLELEVLQFLQQRGQRKNNPSSDLVVASDNLEQRGKGNEENKPNDREIQTYVRGKNFLSLQESASLIRIWTEDALKEIQTTHTEVVVEAIVHEEPGNGSCGDVSSGWDTV
uniref:polycystic kidney disease 1 like 1 n=1 Tax=Monopterus albus TaxID=43700 RepID=UPI0009B38512|nr:polycystic kidney disease protein 1-like 1 [Monopterus albus]